MGRFLPKDFRIPDHSRFFEIPPELSGHQLTSSPHFDEVIVSLESCQGERLSIFLMSQLPADRRLHSVLSELVERIQALIEAGPEKQST